eukprot:scaffold6625_cov139-Skeletonema_marinoi.AAC.6
MGKVEDKVKEDSRGGAGAEEAADVSSPSPSELQQDSGDVFSVTLPSPPNAVITPHSTTNTIASAITTPDGLLGDEHTVSSAIVTTTKRSSSRCKTPPTTDNSGTSSNAGPSTKPTPTIAYLPPLSDGTVPVGSSSMNAVSSIAAHAAKEDMYASNNNGGDSTEMNAEHPPEATSHMARITYCGAQPSLNLNCADDMIWA